MEEKEKRPASSFRYLLVLYLGLLFIAIPLSFLAVPRLLSNIREYQVAEHFSKWKEEEKEERDVDVILTSYFGDEVMTRTVNVGFRDALHYSMEALLSPLSVEEKKLGFVSAIPEGTTLEGAVVRDSIPFVKLSREFLLSEDISSSARAIEKTLSLNLGTEGLVILVGEETVFRM